MQRRTLNFNKGGKMNKIFKLFIKNADDVENPQVRSAYGKVASVIGVLCNVFLCIIKFVAGFISGSVAIMADALNNLTDASSNVISFIGFKLSIMPADKEHPYGHGRYEYLSAFIVSIIILLIGFELLKSGIEKIITPTDVEFSIITVVILLVSILVKVFLSLLNRSGAKKINSNALKATEKDSFNDCIATSAVLVSLLITHFTGLSLDGVMTVAVAVFILFSGVGIIRETLSSLLGKPPEKEKVEYIKNKLLSYDGVLGIHDLIVHDYGVGRQFASVHLEMPAEADVIESHEKIDKIEKIFLEEDGIEVVIHFDPVSTTNPLAVEMREFLHQNVKEINECLSVHDVRIVEGKVRNIAIFDCVLPYNVKISEKELISKLDQLVKSHNPSFDVVVTIDRSFV